MECAGWLQPDGGPQPVRRRHRPQSLRGEEGPTAARSSRNMPFLSSTNHICHHANKAGMVIHGAGTIEPHLSLCGSLPGLHIQVKENFDMITNKTYGRQ